MVNVISEFGSGNPMRTLLFTFRGFYFQFGARHLRLRLGLLYEKNGEIFPLVF